MEESKMASVKQICNHSQNLRVSHVHHIIYTTQHVYYGAVHDKFYITTYKISNKYKNILLKSQRG